MPFSLNKATGLGEGKTLISESVECSVKKLHHIKALLFKTIKSVSGATQTFIAIKKITCVKQSSESHL